MLHLPPPWCRGKGKLARLRPPRECETCTGTSPARNRFFIQRVEHALAVVRTTLSQLSRSRGGAHATQPVMPKSTPSKADLPKKPPKVRPVKDAALMAQKTAEYNRLMEIYEHYMAMYVDGQKARDAAKAGVKRRAAAGKTEAAEAARASTPRSSKDSTPRSSAMKQQPRLSPRLAAAASTPAKIYASSQTDGPERVYERAEEWKAAEEWERRKWFALSEQERNAFGFGAFLMLSRDRREEERKAALPIPTPSQRAAAVRPGSGAGLGGGLDEDHRRGPGWDDGSSDPMRMAKQLAWVADLERYASACCTALEPVRLSYLSHSVHAPDMGCAARPRAACMLR